MASAPSPTPGGYSVTPTEPAARPRAHGSAPAGGTPGAAQTAVRPPLPVKMVIAGGFGVGKTTAVGSISEIEPLTTEAAITEVAAGVDDLTHTRARPRPRSRWTSAASPSTRP
ncbi:hypothetical protein MBT84_11345 [Streptomyces sp. MBT84]|nr:hypothetical protein [Streptomyces sp. MBT84]